MEFATRESTAHAGLKQCSLNVLMADASNRWTSTLGTERVLVVHNLGDQSTTIRGLQVAGTTMEQLWADKGVVKPRLSAEGWEVTLPAGASAVWRAE